MDHSESVCVLHREKCGKFQNVLEIVHMAFNASYSCFTFPLDSERELQFRKSIKMMSLNVSTSLILLPIPFLLNQFPFQDEFNKNLRRTVMRYVNLSTILVYRLVSRKVMERFPDYESLINAKLMLPNEVMRLEKVDAKTPHESTWTPILWAMKLMTKARKEKKINIEPPIFGNLISSFEFVEVSNRKILNYGWVNFPLAYVQVATISVHLYFLASIFGRQFLVPSEDDGSSGIFPDLSIPFSTKAPFNQHTPDFYIPIFTLAEFFCYMGWIKVAESLLNPFGDDDEDFQINYLIDRNLQV